LAQHFSAPFDYRIVRGLGAVGLVEIRTTGNQSTVSEWCGTQRTVSHFFQPNDFKFSNAPSDPLFPSQWALHNRGQDGGLIDADIDAPAAWTVTTGSTDVVVAVLDTGIRYDHPDIQDNIWRNPGEIQGNQLDDDGNGFVDDVFGWDFSDNDNDPMDPDGHGTAVAGIIGAVANNDRTVTGIAWNVSLMALRICEANCLDEIVAVNYVINMKHRGINVRVINASYGGYNTVIDYYLPYDNAGKAGIITVAAAGNEANDNDVNPLQPASLPFDSIISVAATDANDDLVHKNTWGWGSNYGATSVDLAAPGANVRTTAAVGGEWADVWGTSFAAPQVSAAAALAFSQWPNATVAEVKAKILNSVDVIPALAGKVATGGRLNIGKMLREPLPQDADEGSPTNRFDGNNTWSHATDLGVWRGSFEGEYTIHDDSDEDWYRFELLTQDDLDLAIHFDPQWGRLGLELYRPSDSNVSTPVPLAVAQYDNSKAEIVISDPPRGTYLLRVTSGETQETRWNYNRYDLRFIASASSTTRYFYVNDTSTTNDVYCHAMGNWINSGLSPYFPKATVQQVIDTYQLGPSDVVLIDTGSYSTGVMVGPDDRSIIFAGSPFGTTFSAAFELVGSSYNLFYDLRFDAAVGVHLRSSVSGNSAINSTGTELRKLQFRGFLWGVITDDGYHLIEDCLFDGEDVVADTAVRVDNNAHVVVRNSRIENTTWGIDSRSFTEVVDTNLADNDNGVIVRDNARVDIRNSMVGGNVYGVNVLPGGVAGITTSAVMANSYGVFANQAGVTITNSTLGLNTYAIFTQGGSLAVDSCTISDGTYGAWLDSAVTATLEANDISARTYGIYLNGGSDLWVSNNRIHGADYGLYNAGSLRVIVDNNTLENNTVAAYAATSGTLYRNNVIRSNVVGLDGYGQFGESWQSFNSISNNTVGIRPADGQTIAFNQIFYNNFGIQASNMLLNGVLIHNNLLVHNGIGIQASGADYLRVINNTIVTGFGVGVSIENRSRSSVLRNNILYTSYGTGLVVSADSQEGFSSDYNNHFGALQNTTLVNWQRPFVDLLDWQLQSAQDQHSIGTTGGDRLRDHPAFVNQLNGNYRLRSTSTSIDAGDPAYPFANEPAFNGFRIDLGAYGNTELSTPSRRPISLSQFALTASSNGSTLNGAATGDQAGRSVANAGDVNGDGLDDLLIGAPYADPNGSNSGSTYLVFGTIEGNMGTVNLSTFNGTMGYILQGLAAGDRSGMSVSGVGDVNGDGFADLLIGAPFANSSTGYQGQSYLVFGGPTNLAALDTAGGAAADGRINLAALNGTTGFALNGLAAGDYSGFSVSGAGDVNGDGFADLLIGAAWADPNGSYSGQSYLVFGGQANLGSLDSAGGAMADGRINLSALNGATGFVLNGSAAGDKAGRSVSTAGDVNGDGFADLVIGAPDADPNGGYSGQSYLIYGGPANLATLDTAGGGAADGRFNLTAVNGTTGFVLNGLAWFDHAGRSVSEAGDVNGDGFSDLLIGAYGADPNGLASGQSYLVFGGPANLAALDMAGGRPADGRFNLDVLNGTTGFLLNGIALGDQSGISVSGAGDVNGDGFDDLLIGAYGANPNGGDSGQSYVVFGGAANFAALDTAGGGTADGRVNLSTLDGTLGLKVNGRASDDYQGASVSSAGDVNGDGFADLLIAAPWADPNGLSSGQCFLVFGGSFQDQVTHRGTSSADLLIGDTSANVMHGGRGNDTLVGNGAEDVLIGGAGNDVLAVASTFFARVDGGNGSDTLLLDGSGITLDLTTLADTKLTNIETIDIRGSGANALILNHREVLNVTQPSNTANTANTLRLLATGDDSVTIGSGWTLTQSLVGSGQRMLTYTQGAATLIATHFFIAPTDIALSPNGIRENQAIGTTVGNFSTTDPDLFDSFTYTLVSGSGSTDNARFSISGNTLSTAATLDFETKRSYSIRVRSTDLGGWSYERAFTIGVIDSVEIEAGPNQSAGEGSGVSLASASYNAPVPASQLTLTVNWGDGTSEPGVLVPTSGTTGGTIANTHRYADNGTYTVTLTLTDGTNTVSDSFVATISNVAPLVGSIVGWADAVRGQLLSFRLSFTDAGTADTHTASIDWGDGTSSAGLVTGAGSRNAFGSHIYTATGNYTLTFTITDDDGAAVSKTKAVSVAAANLQTSQLDSSLTDLFVGGTTANDTIALALSGANTTVTINAVLVGSFAPTGRIVVFGQAGNDNVTIASTITRNAWLYGDDDNDTLTAGGGNDVLIGGAGTDSQVGGAGNDTYQFDADTALGIDTVNDSAGVDTLDFSATTGQAIAVNLGVITAQVVNPNLTLTLTSASSVENVTGGSLADTLTGNASANLIVGGPGNDTLAGAAGNDVYQFDVDDILGADTLNEAGGGVDTLDFSPTTGVGVTVDLSLATVQTVASGRLTLVLGSATTFENILGGANNDILTGNTLANVITGGAGNDTLAGGTGNDNYLFDADTNLGTDTLTETATGGTDLLDFTGTSAGVTLDLSLATAQVVNANLSLNLQNGGVFENATGGDGSDILLGNALVNVLTGGLGNDSVSGAAGDDSLTGGVGDDTLAGGAGNDTYLYASNFFLGSDTLVELAGGGIDLITFATTTSKVVTLNLGVTTLQPVVGGNLNLTLNAADTFENVIGGSLADTLVGNGLANTLVGGPGNDTLVGGTGDDVYSYTASAALGTDSVVELAAEGIDTLDFSLTTTLAVAVNLGVATTQVVNANLSLVLNAVDTFENVSGGSLNDTLTGNALANRLVGNAGLDTLVGGAGNDTLDGGLGNDNLQGGGDNDFYLLDADLVLGTDTITELVGGGIDTLDFSPTTTKTVAVNLGLITAQTVTAANLTLTLSAADTFENAIGGTLNDTLIGNTLTNRLEGSDGNDTLQGLAGDDTLVGGLGNDSFVFNTDSALGIDRLDESAGGLDTLDFSTSTTLGINLNLGMATTQMVNSNLRVSLVPLNAFENATGGALGDFLLGNDLANILTGNAGNDILIGGAGNDSLTGGLGDDSYRFATSSALGTDTLNESAGGIDTLDFSSSASLGVTINLATTTSQVVNANLSLVLGLATAFENAIGGGGNDSLTGNTLANVLTGNAGNDTLIGLAGNDTLAGGLGDDNYPFTATAALGTDSLVEAFGEGLDLLDFGTTTVAVTVNLGLTTTQIVNANLSLTLSAADAFEMLIGSSVNDTLTGNSLANVIFGGAGNDTLVGLAGRDLLFGGNGNDNLNGGDDEDIVIGGLTTYYSETTKVLDRTAMTAIWNEWIRTDLGYAGRITNLKNGGGLNSTFKLSSLTVLTDTAAMLDTLAGGLALDWFWQFTGDTVSDLNTGGPETVN
jgi:Ca2+-binding RTX toxin-like protein